MALSPIETGGIAGFGIYVTGKLFDVVIKLISNKNQNDNSPGPGRTDTCIKHGEKITEHDTVLKQLCTEMVGTKKEISGMRQESKTELEKIYSVVDEMRNNGK